MLVIQTKEIFENQDSNDQENNRYKKIKSLFNIIQEINLTDFFSGQTMLIAKYTNPWIYPKCDWLKAIILAAGMGTRLGNIPKTSHKTLTNINGTSLIERQIKILKKNNINKIWVVTGYNAKILRNTLSSFNVNFLHNNNYLKTDTLDSFWFARKCMDDELITLYGDVIFEEEIITNLLNSNKHDISLVIDKSKSKEDDDMKVFFDGDLIKKIDKKLPKSMANGKYAGIAKFTKNGCKILKKH